MEQSEASTTEHPFAGDPLWLFKYRSLEGPYGRDTARDIILHNRMYWQSPASFNDPFDCAPTVQWSMSKLRQESFISQAARSSISSSRYDRRVQKREIRARGRRQNAILMRDSLRDLLKSSAVTCFSSLPDSVLMWAHYANSHKGICFVFHERLDPNPWLAFDVKYEKDRPIIEGTRTFDEQSFEDAVLTKAIDWEYEREKRMVDYGSPPGHRKFPPEVLCGVIFGAKMSTDDRKFVEGLLSQSPLNLKQYDAKISDTHFALEIAQI
ncbi:DUF2971 domain-containing protein [uncultured Sphingomonas sp.]|uniref:DUF2971 domain-containing protein n=1 Tax=uncultured Sphingomonas sp. TaxID=158754 RepID=UPI00341538A8